MSTPAIKAFFEQVRKDPAIREKMRNVNATNKEEAAEALVQIAAEAGFEFTVQQYLESIPGAAGGPPSGIINS